MPHENEMAGDRANDHQPIENPAKDSPPNVASPVEPVKADDFDPMEIVPRRPWLDTERVELTRALVRHTHKGNIRYNLTGIHIDGDAGVATDGHRLLVVRDYATDNVGTGKILQVSSAGLMPFEIKGVFPDWRKVVCKDYRATFRLRNFRRLKKMRADLVLSIDKDGFSLEPVGAIASLNLRLLADLPTTDDTLFLSLNGQYDGVLARPELGGWFAIVMPRRAVREDGLHLTPHPFEVPHG